nr:hypothetical protein GCM10020092_093620 [Actinoplanes digitatis]
MFGYRSGEDADTAGTDKQPDDNQDDTPENLPPKEREDAGDHENDCEDPEQQ